MSIKERNIEREMYISRHLAFAEGMYKGLLMGFPKDLRLDSVDSKQVSFMRNEKALKASLATVRGQIAIYNQAIIAGDREEGLKSYGAIIDGLKAVEIELMKTISKMNEPASSDEDDDYGL